MDQVGIIGIDLAKNGFQAHGAQADGSVGFRRKPSRAKVPAFAASPPRRAVAMEACASAHYGGRELEDLGRVKPVPPIYVRPFVKRHKNDAADAEATCKAASRPTMRFVAVKTEGPPAREIDLPHARSSGAATHADHQRAARLAEFGVIAAQGPVHVHRSALAVS